MTVEEILAERIPLAELLAWCRRSPVERLWVFRVRAGRLATRERCPFGRLDLQDELEGLLGRPVDLVPEAAVTNPFIRKRIWDTRRELYLADHLVITDSAQ